ncbi:hypothetical protein BJ944DRAFT_264513 [Cunninghamella echinulata]|nr:hypothetical protein BJ944DRAFT_264513 [Cunninghamella echinulata]
MHPLVWISLLGSGIALAIIGSLEARNHYEKYKERQEYEEYIRYTHRHPGSNEFELPSDSDDDDDNRPLSHIRDQQKLRKRKNKHSNYELDDDKQWYDNANYELSEMETKIIERKRQLEIENSLLEQAEMDLERRKHELSVETNSLLKSKLSELSQSQHSEISQSQHSASSVTSDPFQSSLFSSAHQTPPPLPPRSSLSNSPSSSSFSDHRIDASIFPEQLNNSHAIHYQHSDQQNKSDSNSISSPFVSVSSLKSNQTALKQQSIGSNELVIPHEPWAFEDDDDDDDKENNNMRFPQTINQFEDRHSETSWNTVPSQQQQQQHSSNTSILNDGDDDNLSNFSIRTPAAPSEDGSSSYDMLHGSDIDSQH